MPEDQPKIETPAAVRSTDLLDELAARIELRSQYHSYNLAHSQIVGHTMREIAGVFRELSKAMRDSSNSILDNTGPNK